MLDQSGMKTSVLTQTFVVQRISTSENKVRWCKGRLFGLAGSKSQLGHKFAKYFKFPAYQFPGLFHERLKPDDLYLFLKSLLEDIFFIAFRDRGRERGRTSMWERNINWLSLVGSPTGDQTCNLLVHRTMLQSTEPHRPGLSQMICKVSAKNNILGLSKGVMKNLPVLIPLKNSCSSRVSWHNLPSLWQVTGSSQTSRSYWY